jgi:hypothetical protein
MEKFIAYDICSLPILKNGNKVLSLSDLEIIRKESGYLFYDSRLGKKPEIVNYPPTQSDGMGFKPKNECT